MHCLKWMSQVSGMNPPVRRGTKLCPWANSSFVPWRGVAIPINRAQDPRATKDPRHHEERKPLGLSDVMIS